MLRTWALSRGTSGPGLCRIHSEWCIHSAHPPFRLSPRISSLVALRIFLGEMEELLLTTKPPIPQPPTAPTKKPPPYDRTQYYSYARDRGAAFGKLYSALFTIAKTGQSRNIDIEVGFNVPLPFMSLVFIRRHLDRESLLVRAARTPISDHDRGCRIYYGMLPCELVCHEIDGSCRRRGPIKRSTRMCGVW